MPSTADITAYLGSSHTVEARRYLKLELPQKILGVGGSELTYRWSNNFFIANIFANAHLTCHILWNILKINMYLLWATKSKVLPLSYKSIQY